MKRKERTWNPKWTNKKYKCRYGPDGYVIRFGYYSDVKVVLFDEDHITDLALQLYRMSWQTNVKPLIPQINYNKLCQETKVTVGTEIPREPYEQEQQEEYQGETQYIELFCRTFIGNHKFLKPDELKSMTYQLRRETGKSPIFDVPLYINYLIDGKHRVVLKLEKNVKLLNNDAEDEEIALHNAKELEKEFQTYEPFIESFSSIPQFTDIIIN